MIIVDSGKAIVEILKELHKADETILKAMQNKTQWEAFAPMLYVIIGSGLTLVTQLIIFRLQKKKDLTLFNNNMKKEINFKVAELYGKLNALCPEYNTLFWRYNEKSVGFHFYSFLSDHYQNHISKEGWDSELSETERNNFIDTQKFYSDEKNEHNKISDEKWKELSNQKLKLLEFLHQIQFYYKEDKNLEKMINEFQAIHTHKPEFKLYIKEMGNETYLNKYIDENVKPINLKLLKLSTDIFTCIKS